MSSKKQSTSHPPVWLLVGALLSPIILVFLISIAVNSDIRTFLTRASEDVFSTAPTMKQKNLRIDEPTFQGTDASNTPQPSRRPTQEPSTLSVTPVPILTAQAAAQVCRIDAQMKNNCKCPDMQGLKCNGEDTEGIGNFYWINEAWNDRPPTDSEGFYLPVKSRWIYGMKKAEYEAKKAQPNCTEWCIGKPVIYLYPTKPMMIDVEVEVPGRIYISDPEYPDGGWRKVFAQPDGTLLYQGKYYRDLYYETDLDTDLRTPSNGILLRKDELEAKLKAYTMQLGLSDFESNEFNEYWVPQLNELNSPYVLFSILDEDEKERIDTVYITPKPDTFIAFIAYFKPVYKWYQAEPLILPDTPPERIGYTAVEWGGTIDTGAIQAVR
jgi:hypothetical protein